MMLRVSSELEGSEAELGAVTQGGEVASGVPGETGLLALVEATLDDSRIDELPAARASVEESLGADALIDAAAVIGNFERMTRIADGTGIPLDAPVAALSADFREELGINEFGSAAYTPKVGLLKRRLARMLQPVVIKLFARQMKKKKMEN